MSPRGWTARRIAWRGEDRGFGPSGWTGLRITRGRVGRAVFPPEQVAEVKAIACELPKSHVLPLSRFSRVELHRLVIECGGDRRVGVDDPALAARGRDQAVADPLVDLPARPRVRFQGREGARSLRAHLRGQAPAPGRVRHQRRREDPAAGARARASHRSRQDPAVRAWSSSSTSVVGRSRTWPPGTCTTPSCLWYSDDFQSRSYSNGINYAASSVLSWIRFIWIFHFDLYPL